MIAGRAGGRENGGVRNGGALVAEQAAADDRGHHIGNGDVEGHRHGECDGHHNGPYAPGRAGSEGDQRTKQEDQGGDHAGSQIVLHNVNEELAGAHLIHDVTQRPSGHQDEGDADQLGHAVQEGAEGLGDGEQLGGHAYDAGAHAAAHESDADGQSDVGVPERAHQTIVDDVAAPEDCGKQGGKETHNRNDKVPQGQIISLGQFFLYLGDQGFHAVSQELAGFPGTPLLLVHGAKIQAEGGDNQHSDHGEDAVQVKGQHLQPDPPLVAADAGGSQLCGNQASDEGAVAADGGQGRQVTAHGVQNIGQLGPGDPHGVGDRAHDRAQHQARLRVAEDEGAQAGDDLSFFCGVDDFGDPGCKGVCRACFPKHGNHAARQGDQYDKRCVSAEGGHHVVRDDLDESHQWIIPVDHGGA